MWARRSGASRTPASRFLVEARFGTAVSPGNALSPGNAVSKRLSGTDPDAKLPAAPVDATGLLNRDPEAFGIPERYAATKAQSTASKGGGPGRIGPGRGGSRRWADKDPASVV
jgi:hypothetical protein